MTQNRVRHVGGEEMATSEMAFNCFVLRCKKTAQTNIWRSLFFVFGSRVFDVCQ
jgi:hypothetical protein